MLLMLYMVSVFASNHPFKNNNGWERLGLFNGQEVYYLHGTVRYSERDNVVQILLGIYNPNLHSTKTMRVYVNGRGERGAFEDYIEYDDNGKFMYAMPGYNPGTFSRVKYAEELDSYISKKFISGLWVSKEKYKEEPTGASGLFPDVAKWKIYGLNSHWQADAWLYDSSSVEYDNNSDTAYVWTMVTDTGKKQCAYALHEIRLSRYEYRICQLMKEDYTSHKIIDRVDVGSRDYCIIPKDTPLDYLREILRKQYVRY